MVRKTFNIVYYLSNLPKVIHGSMLRLLFDFLLESCRLFHNLKALTNFSTFLKDTIRGLH